MNLPIYLDYMATTPVDPQVAAKMADCLQQSGVFGNPASRTHVYGMQALALVEESRAMMAQAINADPKEIVWTSGATEANNLAIKGTAQFYQRKGKHIITLATEHKAVLDTCEYLATQGFAVTYLQPQSDGRLDLAALAAALRPDTILISIMHVNNETGVVQDLCAVGELIKGRGIIFHSDMVQSLGKLPVDVQQLPVDLISFSGHKIYGPKGVGVLYVRRQPRVRLQPQMHGGGHERGLRSGTLPTHQIVGMAEAARLVTQQLTEEIARVHKLRDRLWQGLSPLGKIYQHGDSAHCVANCLNICVPDVDGELLLSRLTDIAVSTGAACSSAGFEASHVLLAMGVSHEDIYRSLRMSIGRFTTSEEIDRVIQHLTTVIEELRQQGSVWDKVSNKLKK